MAEAATEAERYSGASSNPGMPVAGASASQLVATAPVALVTPAAPVVAPVTPAVAATGPSMSAAVQGPKAPATPTVTPGARSYTAAVVGPSFGTSRPSQGQQGTAVLEGGQKEVRPKED